VRQHRQDHDVIPSSDIRRKRLAFRSWHRGTRESDLILGHFADAYLARFDDGQLDRYEALLECSDADLFDWITGRTAPPPEHNHDVTHLLLAYTNANRHPPDPHPTPPPHAGEGMGGGDRPNT
jgi:antitoxin CptB